MHCPRASFILSNLDIDVDVDSSSVYSRSGGGMSDGVEDLRQKANVADIFDRKVEAESLGVILDVSFSTHDVISAVIEEIQSVFPAVTWP